MVQYILIQKQMDRLKIRYINVFQIKTTAAASRANSLVGLDKKSHLVSFRKTLGRNNYEHTGRQLRFCDVTSPCW